MDINNTIFTNVNDLSANIRAGFEKAVVKQHTRKSKTGKLVNVKQHTDKRQKKERKSDINRLLKTRLTGRDFYLKEKWGDGYQISVSADSLEKVKSAVKKLGFKLKGIGVGFNYNSNSYTFLLEKK